MTTSKGQADTNELIHRAADGDIRAVDDLMRRHRDRLKRTVRLRMDPRMLARVDPSDVIQETLIRALRDLPEYLKSQPIPFYPWLRRIAWQQLVDHHRRHLDAKIRSARREEPYTYRVSDESSMEITNLFVGHASALHAIVSKKEMSERVREALAALSEMDREVLLQRYVEQLSVPEIAAVLDSTEAAVYKRHARALKRVRLALEGDFSGPSK